MRYLCTQKAVSWFCYGVIRHWHIIGVSEDFIAYAKLPFLRPLVPLGLEGRFCAFGTVILIYDTMMNYRWLALRFQRGLLYRST
jgi:hypothetical protein